MANPFIAEIRIFPFNFAPTGWAMCQGQLLPISQNTALFSLLGTTYGGNGKSNFALPNLQGCAPVGWGQGAGLSLYELGESTGQEVVTLQQTEMAQHNHLIMAQTNDPADNRVPSQNLNLGLAMIYQNSSSYNAQLAFNAIAPAGGGQPHTNLMPYLTLNFCIALQGVYPPRN
jgi:microcystin-dependent protein